MCTDTCESVMVWNSCECWRGCPCCVACFFLAMQSQRDIHCFVCHRPTADPRTGIRSVDDLAAFRVWESPLITNADGRVGPAVVDANAGQVVTLPVIVRAVPHRGTFRRPRRASRARRRAARAAEAAEAEAATSASPPVLGDAITGDTTASDSAEDVPTAADLDFVVDDDDEDEDFEPGMSDFDDHNFLPMVTTELDSDGPPSASTMLQHLYELSTQVSVLAQMMHEAAGEDVPNHLAIITGLGLHLASNVPPSMSFLPSGSSGSSDDSDDSDAEVITVTASSLAAVVTLSVVDPQPRRSSRRRRGPLG